MNVWQVDRSLDQRFSLYGTWTSGTLEIFLEDSQGQDDLHYNTKLLLFLCVDLCSNGTTEVMEKTLGALAHIRAGIPNCASSHCSSIPRAHS